MFEGHLRARGLLRPTGLLTLPGEDWSPSGKRPRNSYMTNLDGLCQGGPEGETYPKTTRIGKATKKQTKRKSGRVLREPHRRYSQRKRREERLRPLRQVRGVVESCPMEIQPSPVAMHESSSAFTSGCLAQGHFPSGGFHFWELPPLGSFAFRDIIHHHSRVYLVITFKHNNNNCLISLTVLLINPVAVFPPWL